MDLSHRRGVADGQAVELGMIQGHQDAAVDQRTAASAPAVSGSVTGARPNRRGQRVMQRLERNPQQQQQSLAATPEWSPARPAIRQGAGLPQPTR